VFYEQGIHTTTLLTFEDVTDRRAVEEKVQERLRERDTGTAFSSSFFGTNRLRAQSQPAPTNSGRRCSNLSSTGTKTRQATATRTFHTATHRNGEFGLAFGLQTHRALDAFDLARVLNQIEGPIGLVRGNFFF
jgi:hypothetical protein